MTMSVEVMKLSLYHIDDVARLHVEGIPEGFISSLGRKFVRHLYRAILESDRAFGFVAVQDGRVLGFISCALSVGQIYKDIIKKHCFKLIWAILPKMCRPSHIKNAIETLLYPKRIAADLPAAELLSIVVDEDARGLGVGKKLLQHGMDEFRERGLTKIKVMVGEWLPANEFYKRNGFVLIGSQRHHGHILNTYVLDL